MLGKVKIAVLQLCSTANKLQNFNVCRDLIVEASKTGAKMAFLPENFDFICENKDQLWELRETLDGELITKYRTLAKENNIYLSLGGFHRRPCEDPSQVVDNNNNINNQSINHKKSFNTHVIIDNEGRIVAKYDKLHLFDAKMSDCNSYHESNTTERGAQAEEPVITPIGLVGMGICYDLRFADFSWSMREKGATILTFPSAFTVPTGSAHWHVLLRSRAIETQSFVIAAAQEGIHNDRRVSYGHSVVVDPWGQIVNERSQPGPGLLVCDIDTSLVDSVRQKMPTINHRRLDLFPSPSAMLATIDIGVDPIKFGPHVIPASCVFYKSVLSFAFVNISPVVAGHALVSPLRLVPRFNDLTRLEVTDLYQTVQHIASKLCNQYQAKSVTITQQDGVDAGQTVPHVHVHILPRKPGDFQDNNDIYKTLEKHDKATNVDRKFRSVEVMGAEAAELRKLFY